MTAEQESRERKFLRMNRGLVMSYRKISTGGGELTWNMTWLDDLGLGGCAFKTDQPYAAGEQLELRIKLPGVEELMRFIGKVVSRPDEESLAEEKKYGTYKIRVTFLEMDKKKQGELARLIAFHNQRQAGGS